MNKCTALISRLSERPIRGCTILVLGCSVVSLNHQLLQRAEMQGTQVSNRSLGCCPPSIVTAPRAHAEYRISTHTSHPMMAADSTAANACCRSVHTRGLCFLDPRVACGAAEKRTHAYAPFAHQLVHAAELGVPDDRLFRLSSGGSTVGYHRVTKTHVPACGSLLPPIASITWAARERH